MAADGAELALTLDEAAAWLHPPISRAQLAAIVAALRIPPAGSRPQPNGRRGRPVSTYPAGELMRLHAAIAPWLVREMTT